MKKVINVTLSGIVFAIEQDAYEQLETYLQAVKSTFANTADQKEITADIETAIAEKFLALGKDEKTAVTVEDIHRTQKEMGSPADYSDTQTEEKRTDDAEDIKVAVNKRLYRDTEHKVISGVASGIALYMGLDVVLVRVLFFITLFFSGTGIVLYIILWILVPAAETTAQKFAMRGQSVTLKDISARVKNLTDIGSNTLLHPTGLLATTRSFLVKVFELFGQLARGAFKIVRFLFALGLIIGGILGTIGLCIGYAVVFFSDKVLFPTEMQMAFEMVLGSTMGMVAVFASFMMILIPLLLAILWGSSMLARANYLTLRKTIALGVVWVIAIVLAGTTGALQLEKIAQKFDAMQPEYRFEQYHQMDVESDTDIPVESVFEDGSIEGEESDDMLKLPASSTPNR